MKTTLVTKEANLLWLFENIPSLISQILQLHQEGSLWDEQPTDDIDKRPLSAEGRNLVKAAVKALFRTNMVIPLCSISGADGRAESDIISLNEKEFIDLIANLQTLMDD